MNFNTEILRSEWQDDAGKWRVKLRQTSSSGETKEFEEECDLLLYATGLLNNFKWPRIPGIDRFKGRVIHTAIWPKDYQKEQWANDRVASIGSGALSIQTVPTMQGANYAFGDRIHLVEPVRLPVAAFLERWQSCARRHKVYGRCGVMGK